jgi:hypothetical protein
LVIVDDDMGSAFFQGLVGKSVGVEPVAFDGNKKRIGLYFSGVD